LKERKKKTGIRKEKKESDSSILEAGPRILPRESEIGKRIRVIARGRQSRGLKGLEKKGSKKD